MTATIIIAAVTCLIMIGLVLFKPGIHIKGVVVGTYWIVALVGAIALIAAGFIGVKEVGTGLVRDTGINPVKILVLFISMTFLSVFLDEAGFFRYMANSALQKAGLSQKRLFVTLYFTVAVLTVFTSNDIIILTFTPFICYFARQAKISPVPYLVAEFVAANTWSMLLIIGNPTNIYISTASGIAFIPYLKFMALPTLFAGVVNFGFLCLVFRKMLSTPLEPVIEEMKIRDMGLLIIGIVHLGLCTVLLVISSYIQMEMWFITLCFALSLVICTLIYKLVRKSPLHELGHSLKRAPWELVPFVVSMFVIVLALEKQGVTAIMARYLNNRYDILSYGAASFLFSNLINNIPMSVLFSEVLASGSTRGALFASVAGSNIGAFLTPVGALAGIMWVGILKTFNVKFSFVDFIKYGIITAIPTMLAAIGGIYLSDFIF
ncbi:MAG TPA: ArsB/NhaD family transporter [Clostridia bacterium]|nr:ArsB/NhaD family transporter [Clostridia bacterium]